MTYSLDNTNNENHLKSCAYHQNIYPSIPKQLSYKLWYPRGDYTIDLLTPNDQPPLSLQPTINSPSPDPKRHIVCHILSPLLPLASQFPLPLAPYVSSPPPPIFAQMILHAPKLSLPCLFTSLSNQLRSPISSTYLASRSA